MSQSVKKISSEAKISVSKASKLPTGARISKGLVGTLKF